MAKQKIERTQLLKNTITLLLKNGYHNTSMADIADICSMSKAGLYHHFDSKLDLVTAALNQVHHDFLSNVLSYANKTNLTPHARFMALLDAVEAYFISQVQQGGSCVMTNISLETSGQVPIFLSIIKAFFNDWRYAYQQLLATVFTDKDAKALAESAIAQTQGALVFVQIYGDENHLKRVNRGLLQCWDRQAQLNQQTKTASQATQLPPAMAMNNRRSASLR